MQEKIYHIPKNLNSDFSFIGCYSMGDLGIILIVLLISIFAVASTGIIHFIILPIMLCVFKFKLNGYSVSYWTRTAISFLFANLNHKHSYTLFERREIKWK